MITRSCGPKLSTNSGGALGVQPLVDPVRAEPIAQSAALGDLRHIVGAATPPRHFSPPKSAVTDNISVYA